MNNTQIEVNLKNITALVAQNQMQQEEINALRVRLNLMENNLQTLRAELQNTKQLMGHLSGRGMGSTA